VSLFSAAPIGIFGGAVFTSFLLAASLADLRSRRIPNQLAGALAVVGIAHALVVLPPLVAIRFALGGGAVGLALWLPFWALKVLGAGDVKLAAAAGTWLGIAGVLEASLWAAAMGGVLAFWALARHGGVAAGVTRFGVWMLATRVTRTIVPELTPKERRIPYGVAIALGAAVAAWFPGLIL